MLGCRKAISRLVLQLLPVEVLQQLLCGVAAAQFQALQAKQQRQEAGQGPLCTDGWVGWAADAGAAGRTGWRRGASGLSWHAHTGSMDLLLEPLSHAFMVKALLVSALVGGVCGLLSCYMTLKGWALMGDAVSHAVLPGVVVAYALGLPFSLGAFVFGVGSVAAIGFVKQKSRVKEDTVIGLVFTGFFALGLVLVSKTRSNIDLTHICSGTCWGSRFAGICNRPC